jgi:TctA family transporter
MTQPSSPPDQRMGPTRPSLLVVAALASAAVGWLLLSGYYQDMPALPWLPTVTVGALAIVEAILAQNTRARVERRPGHPKVDPLAVARYVVLAKASSLAGAIFGGFSAGLLSWLTLEPTKAARDDVPAAIAAVVAALALVAAALWLERACRVPPRGPDDDEQGGQSRQH